MIDVALDKLPWGGTVNGASARAEFRIGALRVIVWHISSIPDDSVYDIYVWDEGAPAPEKSYLGAEPIMAQALLYHITRGGNK